MEPIGEIQPPLPNSAWSGEGNKPAKQGQYLLAKILPYLVASCQRRTAFVGKIIAKGERAHVLLWRYSDDPALPKSCRKLITQPDSSIFVSAVSAWEIATKFRLGRLASASELVQDFGGYLDREKFLGLPVSYDHGVRAGMLPGPHQDPFDRMLIAQAEIEKLFMVSNKKIFDHYGVHRVW